MNRLASAKIQKGLAVPVCDLGRPSHGVNPVGFKEAELQVGGQQSIPLTVTSTLAKEQRTDLPAYFTSIVQYVHRRVALCLHSPSFVKLPDHLLGRKCAIGVWYLVLPSLIIPNRWHFI